MKRLMHMSTTKKYLEWFEDDWDKVRAVLKRHQLDGIELGLTLDYDITQIPKDIIKGIHLSFYPMWLDFWRGDLERVKQHLGDEEAIRKYYGGLDKAVIIESYRAQYERAKAVGAQYMVFHVSHVTMEDSFTFKYSYTDQDVVSAAVELINEVFTDEDGPMLLFENLWWPGLTYTDKTICRYLLDNVQYKNKGFVLDVSHLILMNPKLDTEQKCVQYIKDVVETLGDMKSYIYTVHLNKTLPKHYMRQDHKYKLERYKQAKTAMQRNKILLDHVHKMDTHMPFDHPVAKELLDYIEPKYCVYETNPSTPYELNYFMKQQNKALGIIE